MTRKVDVNRTFPKMSKQGIENYKTVSVASSKRASSQIKLLGHLDTSPTQGRGKVGARSGQGLDKKQGSGRVWAGKVWTRFGQGWGMR